MLISLNWLKEYVDLEGFSPEKIGEVLTDIGLEVEGVETVHSLPGGLKGVVIGQVLTCKRHPNADRLSLTTVDIGSGEPLSIVCGAPNVAEGQKVLVATVGTTLHPNGGDPLTIRKAKVRGEVSEGMICAEDELGLGDDHQGIMVLPNDARTGRPASEYFEVETDTVYEIGLTPNRSDATNHLGVARDLAAALRVNYGHSGTVRLPDVEGFASESGDTPVKVRVEHAVACPRYAGLTLTGLKPAPSPEWLKRRLRAVGVRPINNVVDITNFVLHELGQPLHAFDLEKISGQEIIVKTLPEGTPFTSLDGVTRKLSGEDLMICDGDSHGMCIGGVFGGLGTGVTEDTTAIFLESAHFNPQYIRRSSMRHNLRTDAAKVFEKGSDPNIAVFALKRAAMLMHEYAGGRISSGIVDIYPQPVEPRKVQVSYAHLDRLCGIEMPRDTVEKILEALHMDRVSATDEGFTVAVPTNKADVTREVDVIEEILRIYGYNNIPMPKKISTALADSPKPDPVALRNTIGDLLAGNGFNEMMAVSLSESKYYQAYAGLAAEEELVFVHNTSNVHLDIMRPDMLFGGLEAILHNQNRQQQNIKLFEFGRTYRRNGDAIQEHEHLAVFMTGQRHPDSWLADDDRQSDFYALKAYVTLCLGRLGVSDLQTSELQGPAWAFGIRLHHGPRTLVEFGRVASEISQGIGIRSEVYYADFQWEECVRAAAANQLVFKEVTKYPSVRRDLAIVIEKSVKFDDIVAIARKAGKPLLKDIGLFDTYENDEQLGAGKKSYAIRFVFEDSQKTLKDAEVDTVIGRLAKSFEKQLGASIRS